MLTDLPPLPPHRFCLNSSPVMVGYTAEEMTAYAREAQAATLATVTPLVQHLVDGVANLILHRQLDEAQREAFKDARAFLSGATKESTDHGTHKN